MMREAIAILSLGRDLKENEARAAFEDIFQGRSTAAQTAAFLTALSIKGESKTEIYAAAECVRRHANKINVKRELAGIVDPDDIVFDSCGTGGGGVEKFNISTAVSLIVAAAGVKVAKHGNRAMSSKTGSADCFEALGVKIDGNISETQDAIKEIGIGFLFAPHYHPALKDVAVVRREIGIKTIFNIVGPLSNPAMATHQLLGVYRRDLLPVMADVLRRLGVKRAMIVHSEDLKDEISLSGRNYAVFLDKKKIVTMRISAATFGLKRISLRDILTQDPQKSAAMVKQVLNGKKNAARDIVLANAACALYTIGQADSLRSAARRAAQIIDSGAAAKKLAEMIKFFRRNH